MKRTELLVVDDSPTQAAALRALLEAEGFGVTVAGSGEAALERLRRDRFDLVLTDVIMPGMTGFELCRRIKDEGGDAPPPVVLLTSLRDPRDVVRGLEAGADNYLTKPYEPEHLVARLRRVLERGSVGFERVEPVAFTFLGETFQVRSGRRRIVDFLLSSFEELIRTNEALEASKRALAEVHERELKREQAAREEAEEVAERMERLAREAEGATRARDELLAAVSHDLRNPLGTIYTSATLVLEADLAREVLERQIHIIRRSAERMNRLIGDLLDASRMEAGGFAVRPVPESPETLVREAAELMDPLASEKRQQLDVQLEDGLPRVMADRSRALQIFSNLVGNALKFTPEGGRVTLAAEAADGGVRFSITDTGPGIDAEHLPLIFDRFWQGVAGGSEGAGLGLTIARGIVEAHGGTIGVDSTPGQGTTFHFVLPAAPEEEEEEGEEKEEEAAAAGEEQAEGGALRARE
jgi:two-component system, sensor histidine kinase and response regulator